jgi:hypothetical protein
MPRTLPVALQALIDSGHRKDHTALILTLASGVVLRFATATIQVGDDLFQGVLGQSDPLKTSLDATRMDGCTLKVQNVDMVLGRQLTSASTALDGATAILGVIFQNEDTGETWFDPKMPGDIIAGEVNENEVQLNFICDLYASQIAGVTISSVFPYQNAQLISRVALPDRNDLGDPNDTGDGHKRGRLPDDPFLGFLHV